MTQHPALYKQTPALRAAVMAEEQRTSNTSNPAASMDQDNNDNVAFKVHLRTQNKEEEEVRRFTLKGSSCSYRQLVSQLVSMFPQLEAAVYAVSWTDEEGDAVTVSSQEELGLAMEEMAGPVYRFRVVVKEQRKMKQRETSPTASRGTAIMLPPMLSNPREVRRRQGFLNFLVYVCG